MRSTRHFPKGTVKHRANTGFSIAPEGFDMSLSEILTKYTLSVEELEAFKKLHTGKSSLVYAFVRGFAFYRRSQIEEFFKGKETQHEKQSTVQ